MWRRLGIAVAIGIAIACCALPAQAKRVALVVGIDKYDNLGADEQLKKARNDAEAIRAALTEMDFYVIPGGIDVTRREFNSKLLELQNRLLPGDVALIFYAGHGVERDGQNYLLPRDIPKFEAGQEKLLPDEAIGLAKILDALSEKATQVNLVILDACREDPFAPPGARGGGGSRGLSRVEPANGTFVMFSAGAKQVAFDGLPGGLDEDANSVFTRKLLPLLRQKGVSIQDMAKDVQEQVSRLALTRNATQTPAYYDQITGRFYLNPASNQEEREIGGTTEAPAISPKPDVVANSERSADLGRAVVALERTVPIAKPQSAEPAPLSSQEEGELAYYDCIQENKAECYKSFLRRYSDHPRASQIRKIMEAQLERPKYEACNQETDPVEQFRACDEYNLLYKDGRFSKQVNDILAALDAQKKTPTPPPATPTAPLVEARLPETERPNEARKTFVQYDGYDVPGEDYAPPIKNVSRSDCQFKCENDSRCNAFTYDRRNNWCFLKGGAGRLDSNANASSGVSDRLNQPSPGAPAGAPPQITPASRTFTTYDGYDIPGGDYGGPVKNVSRDGCMSTCRSDGGCVAFTYDKKNRWCFLKSSAGGREPNGKAFSGVLSSRSSSVGTVTAAGGGMQMLTDTDFTGMDLDRSGIKPTSLGGCRQICLGNPRCQAFSWIQESGWCWPKSGIPRPRNKSGVISGFRN